MNPRAQTPTAAERECLETVHAYASPWTRAKASEKNPNAWGRVIAAVRARGWIEPMRGFAPTRWTLTPAGVAALASCARHELAKLAPLVAWLRAVCEAP